MPATTFAPPARYLDRLIADPPTLGAVRAGAPIVAATTAAALAALAKNRSLGLSLFALAAWSAWFFRDPPRQCPGEPGTLYAAADGVITAIDEVEWDWFVHGRALRIVTFLSAFDVHVNRSPAAGRLVAYRRDSGGFAPAFLVGGSERNARQLLGIEEGWGPGSEANRIVVAQIVGLLARRIVSWRLPGDTLAAGQKLGMIRFGSRTDVLIPAGLAEPLVTKGTRVRAGLTPIARYK
ncbi:MAG: phosphatidylserine decarboxylase [Chloroflexi bacterium]|nr:phosphatidylserine decarboxylase [Chloroflexota bacterium]